MPDTPRGAAAKGMRRDSAGRITHAAVNYLQVALTALYPESPFAAAPVTDPPFDWPLDVVLWKPKPSDPARMLVEASELLQLAYELVVNETSFDDKAPPSGRH